MIVILTEEQRQLTLLALAICAIERPGFLDALEEVALKMDNAADGHAEMFRKFWQLNREQGPRRIKP